MFEGTCGWSVHHTINCRGNIFEIVFERSGTYILALYVNLALKALVVGLYITIYSQDVPDLKFCVNEVAPTHLHTSLLRYIRLMAINITVRAYAHLA